MHTKIRIPSTMLANVEERNQGSRSFEIPTRAERNDLWPGDLVKLSLGAVVAADVKLTSGEVLLDQSMLTGESVPIEAGAGVTASAAPGG